MKLAFLFTRNISLRTWEKGGNLEREILLYKKLSESLEKIYFFTYGDAGDLRFVSLLPENIEIIPRPRFVPKLLYVLLMPIIHARIFRSVDVIKTNQMDGSWAGVIGRKLYHKKLIVRSGYEWLNYLNTTKASFYKKAIAKMVESWSYKNADKILITSNEDKDFIVNNFKIENSKVEVIRNYIDTEKFKPNNSISKEPKRIIFVGRLHKDKNLAMLIEGLQGVNCKLVLIGDGPEKKNIQKNSVLLGVNIEMLGKVSQDNLPRELQKSQVFILPSQSEGNPKVLLEAMACGLPCVGTNVKGIREVLDDRENGLLAEVSYLSLREKIKSLLENKDLRDKLGTNAREKIIQEYSILSILNKELEIYKNL